MTIPNRRPPIWLKLLPLSTALALPLVLGLFLRLYALGRLYLVVGDSLIYGDIARHLLQHGQYALTGAGSDMYPTLIRLPGYPFLLASCFRLFGMENYFSACLIGIALELAGCVLLADAARRIAPPQLARNAGRITLWIACLCPFTASYCAAPMAETPTLFAIALALNSAVRFRQRPGWGVALAFTFGLTFAALLRPDGALVALALAPAAIFGLPRAVIAPRRLVRMAVLCVLLALTPFALWTARNWVTLEVFQPLAPRLATDPGEDPHLGWEAWIKSWCLDFNCTYNIYWNVPGDTFDLSVLPSYAFDSPAQRAETKALVDSYNHDQVHDHDLTTTLDGGFAKIAAERAALHPWRTRVGMPLGRLADMWLAPRTENLPVDLDWWKFDNHEAETIFAWSWIGLNLLYVSLGVLGLCLRPRFWQPMAAYFLLRSAMLLTVQAPEARYTLECFPMLFVAGGIAVAWLLRQREMAQKRSWLARAQANEDYSI